MNGPLPQRLPIPALVLGAVIVWLHLFGFDLGMVIQGATPTPGSQSPQSTAQQLMHEGRLQSALAAYPESLDSPSSGAIDQSLVRGYLQLRHLNQGQAGVHALACPNRSMNCLLARRMARHYDDSNTVSTESSAEMDFSWGESGHAVVSMQGFEREGVLGLDMLHALGGFKLDTRTRRATFLGGRCPVERNSVVMMESGVPVMLVDIDGRPHRALIDTGSTRSYVFDRSAGASAMRVRSDFGDVHLQGEIRASMIQLDGKTLTGHLVHTNDSGRFITGTPALLGADVLFSGSTFGLWFEPARLWIE